MRTLLRCVLGAALGVAVVAPATLARETTRGGPAGYVQTVETIRPAWDNAISTDGMFASTAQNTTVLYTARFESGASCTQEGWTTVDLTTQLGDYFHVDDFAGLNPAQFAPLDGNQSLWCGARPVPSGPLCGYLGLPGYGNSWDQAFCTKDCIAVSGDGILDVSFLGRFDAEPGFDASFLEYTTDCTGASGWTVIDGGIGVWDGVLPTGSYGGAYDIGTTGPVKVRLRFASDGAYSDEDNLYASNGALVVDNLTAEGLATEDFEDEAVGATSSNDWDTCTPPGYGNYLALFPGQYVVQQDPCARDLLCLWAAISGSTNNYACGGFPSQAAVPFGNDNGQYLMNEVWSPDIALTGSGASFVFEFSVYRDLPLDNLVFYVWHIRSKPAAAVCPTGWLDRGFVYFGDRKDWYRQAQSVGDMITHSGPGAYVNLALGVWDMCAYWCGLFFPGACHSHAPLLDSVKFMRVDAPGPQWAIRDIDMFQDNFAEPVDYTKIVSGEFTAAGRARADMALSVLPASNPVILPGDSAVVRVSDSAAGLATDPGHAGRAAVYGWVSVKPDQAGKTGAPLSGGARWPVVGSWTDAGGTVWTQILCDSARTSNNLWSQNAFCLDLNDNLFEPGDMASFFFTASNTHGVETAASGSNLAARYTNDREAAAAAASEFSILPYGPQVNTILYVDGMDGRGSQPMFDTAFQKSGVGIPDRYDVRGPSSSVGNRPSGRVKDVDQLLAAYSVIIWDTGDLSTTLGDGTGYPEKSNDWGLVNDFLDGLTVPGGVYIGGDDLGTSLHTLTNSAVTFRTMWLTSTLTSTNARVFGAGVNPSGVSQGGAFPSDPTFVIFGGCPIINDFDVLAPTGTAVNEITYNAGTPTSNNGAVLSQVTLNSQNQNIGVLFGGFSFAYIRDDEQDGVMDRADFMYDAVVWLGIDLYVISVAPGTVTSLGHNYPNPFNPQTTIAFSIARGGPVTLTVYNVAGERVRTLVSEELAAGAHTKTWDGRNDAGAPVSSGVYFYRLVATDFSQTKKMVLLK